MALTNLAKLVQRDQYRTELMLQSLRKSVFWLSGVIQTDKRISDMLAAKVGAIFELHYFNPLADDDSRVSTDTAVDAVPNDIGVEYDRAVALHRNQSWGSYDLNAMMSTTGDPMVAIASNVTDYWARQFDIICINIVKGIQLANVVNNSGDMTNDQSALAITTNMVIDTKQTSGDAKDVYGLMICHSAIDTKFQKDGVTDKIYSDEGKLLYRALNGLALVVTDSVDMPSIDVYTSYIVGSGVVGFGETDAKNANATERNEKTGNGAGEETLYSRKSICLHPYGHKFLGASMVATTPTNAELALAANWERVQDRKRIKAAFLLAKAA